MWGEHIFIPCKNGRRYFDFDDGDELTAEHMREGSSRVSCQVHGHPALPIVTG
jgi:hypothetical protein